MLTQLKRYCFIWAVLTFSLISSYGLGYPLTNGYFLAMACFWLVLHQVNKTTFNIVFIINLIVCVGFAPIARLYGQLSIGLIASVFETNTQESVEFLASLPWHSWMAAIIVLCSGVGVLIANKPAKKLYWLSKHSTLILFSLFVILTLHKPLSGSLKRHLPFTLERTLVGNIHFYVRAVQLIKQYQLEKQESQQILSGQPAWQIQSVTPKYKNYVLIIGESARADYQSLYGFPLNTSPYLSQSKGLVLDNFIAPAPNTQPSLTRMLHYTQNDKVSYPNNIISLANEAGFLTYWLSTQPTGHDADTAASRVGIQAKQSYFSSPNASRHSIGIGDKSDFALLDKLNYFLNQNNDNKNALYVLHINGSHPIFCRRLVQPVSEKFKNDDMSCYLETLKQTDKLLEQIETSLKQHGSYSILYLSDHGLAHSDKETSHVNLYNSNQYKQAYHVPFIIISSDDVQQKRQQAARSGFHFIQGFAQWLGIADNRLTLSYSFFSEEPATEEINVFNWEKIVPYQSLQDDPALKP
ncbi:sulfatase-like hydrolase/transferase [Wielerella bovis]|uniref:phosphoethanolamine transferase n=1 Tax=Wielerella bovis TaxID=2917790 RepID=UPI002018F92E|nr:phosphoethanolamine transferase [Wielerella bovis]ULJ69428.1 sulfatase-like hydrolase/transferase [Wielerella bovis]